MLRTILLSALGAGLGACLAITALQAFGAAIGWLCQRPSTPA